MSRAHPALILVAALAACGDGGDATPADADIPIDGEMTDGSVATTDAASPADAGPPGDPTVTPVPEFDSDVFRQQASVVSLADGRVLVAGGLIMRGPPGGGPARGTGREEAEVFDLVNKQITTVAPLHEGRRGGAAVLLADGTVLVTGGSGGPPGEFGVARDTAEIFNPATDEWTLLTETMTAARAYHGSWLLRGGPHAGKVLIAGGMAQEVPELYDPSTGEFSALAAAGAPANAPGAPFELADQRVLFIAGIDADGEYKDNYIYDAATGSFTAIDSLDVELSRYSASLLPDGRVLVAGGYSEGAGSTALRFIDPTTGEVTMSNAAMAAPRYLHTASVLPSGRVAIITGFSQPGTSDASVDIYDPATDTLSPAVGQVGLGRAYAQSITTAAGVIFVVGGQVVINQNNTAIVANVDLVTE